MIILYHRKNEIAIDLKSLDNIAAIEIFYTGKMYGESQLPDDWILMSNSNRIMCLSLGNAIPELIMNYLGLINIKNATVVGRNLEKHPVNIIVEDIDYWENIEGDFDKMTQYWEGFSSYHEKTDILYTNIVKKDLISNDGEFYFSDSTPYQGDYHQHSDGQAMTGSEHTEESEPIYRKSSKDKIFKPRKGISQRKINSYKNNYNIPSVRGFTKPDYNEAKKLKKVPISKDGFVKAEPIMTTLKAPKIKVKKIETKKY